MTSDVPWKDKRLVLFGGKGGVGKTTCAAAFALSAARGGRKTLLVSTDPAHSLGDILLQPLGDAPKAVENNLWAVEIDSEKQTEIYIDGVRRRLAKMVTVELRHEMERQIELARISPGAEEAALLDRMSEIIQQARDEYDLLVFDTAPTGHTLRLLILPELMQAWVDGLLKKRRSVNQLAAMWRGMTVGKGADDSDDPVEAALNARRRKFYQAREVLADAARTAFVFVLNAERLPILETAKAIDLLEHHGVPIGGLIVNRILPDEAAEHPFFAARKAREQSYLEQIDKRFAKYPRVRVAMSAADIVGADALARIAEAFEAR